MSLGEISLEFIKPNREKDRHLMKARALHLSLESLLEAEINL